MRHHLSRSRILLMLGLAYFLTQVTLSIPQTAYDATQLAQTTCGWPIPFKTVHYHHQPSYPYQVDCLFYSPLETTTTIDYGYWLISFTTFLSASSIVLLVIPAFLRIKKQPQSFVEHCKHPYFQFVLSAAVIISAFFIVHHYYAIRLANNHFTLKQAIQLFKHHYPQYASLSPKSLTSSGDYYQTIYPHPYQGYIIKIGTGVDRQISHQCYWLLPYNDMPQVINLNTFNTEQFFPGHHPNHSICDN